MSLNTRLGAFAARSAVECKNLRALIEAGGAVIDDAHVSTGTVFSSQETVDRITLAIAALVDGAPGALDTLRELADALAAEADAVAALTTAVAARVRYDGEQALDGTQRAQARANIGAVAADDIGDPDTDLVAIFEAALED